MTSQAGTQGLSLYDAARAMGVQFANENEPQDKYITANGLRFHYLEWGSADKPPMLLLHGFAQTCHSWDFVALGFSDDYRVIVLDQRGHGDSDWAPDGDYSPETQQQDISAVVDGIGLRDFVLMGLSMGGRNSFTYAANNPENIKALVIVDAAPQNMQQGTANIRNFVQQDDELESVDAFVQRVLQYNPRRDPQQVRGSIMHNLKELPNGNWTWKYDRALRRPGRRMGSDPETERRLWSYLGMLQCPTLLVRGGASDIVALDTADKMAEVIPDGRIATIENAGHLVMGDSPSGFQNAVNEFIASL